MPIFFPSLKIKIIIEKTKGFSLLIGGFFENINYPLLLIAIFLLRIPAFYYFPIRSAIFTTHTLSSLFIIVLFFVNIILKTQKGSNIRLSHNIITLTIIIFYFISQSLSILNAINIPEYLRIYKNIIIGLMTFLIIFNSVDSKEKLNKLIATLILTIFINIIYQSGFYFKLPYLKSFMSIILYDKYLNFIELQAQRQRFFIEVYDIVLLPLIIYLSIREKKFANSFVLILLLNFAILFAFLSNYRILLGVSLFGFLFSIFLFKTFIKHKVFILIFALFLTYYFGSFIANRETGFSVVNRVLIEREEDIKSIQSRFYFWDKAVEMGRSSSFFGIGLGNYYDNLSPKYIVKLSFFDPKNNLMKVTAINPHNIFFSVFAETGLVGLLALICLLTVFIFFDIRLLKKNHPLGNSLIVSFWALFMFSLVGPTFDLQYQTLYWLLRGLIYKSNQSLIKEFL